MLKRYLKISIVAFFAVVAFVAVGLKCDLNKSEWAAWVQAVGSILAILVSSGFVIWQHKTERQKSESARLDLIREWLAEIDLSVARYSDIYKGIGKYDSVQHDLEALFNEGRPLRDLAVRHFSPIALQKYLALAQTGLHQVFDAYSAYASSAALPNSAQKKETLEKLGDGLSRLRAARAQISTFL